MLAVIFLFFRKQSLYLWGLAFGLVLGISTSTAIFEYFVLCSVGFSFYIIRQSIETLRGLRASNRVSIKYLPFSLMAFEKSSFVLDFKKDLRRAAWLRMVCIPPLCIGVTLGYYSFTLFSWKGGLVISPVCLVALYLWDWFQGW
jgi:hypothetical protein